MTASARRGRGRPQALPDPREFIPRLRAAGVPDSVIAEAMELTRQAIHARYGPRPDVPALQPAPKARPLPDTPLPDRSAFSAGLRRWRHARGLTQTQAAKTLGVHMSTLVRWEKPLTRHPLAHIVLDYLARNDGES